ncbi:hypothetical protein HNP55_004621 [Paucibacter oligotrophus]|uniref:SpoVT-AbrB domain-containing protein n=1 Tax=Roseateles oligotrophus TaxID=1769250 RepID=A0A840LL87_9BURK|nr:hypothetical protein [Roseateles oligotrophus]MBB4846067.1 hypothetical protein [Roseateles oligotrophus]
MLAKLTVKNQLTLPKSVTQSLGPVQYFEVQEKAGQIILTPVRIQRGDALRAKLAELEIGAKTIESALSWAGKKTAAEKTSSPKTVAKKISAEKTAALKKTAVKPLSQAAAAKPLKSPAKKAGKTIETPLRAKTPARKSAPKPLSAATAVLAQKTLKKTASEVKQASRPVRPSVQAKASKRGSSKA